MIKNLGLAGGGFFGIAHVAVLSKIEEHNIVFERIKGVSVGSMVAALYAVGYTANELKEIMFSIDFDALIKDNYFSYFYLHSCFGMYQAKALEDKVEELIAAKTLIKNCTFNQIPIDLTVISTNLNYQRATFFNKVNTPFMAISKAVRMSIGYPGIIAPVLYEGDYYGDGGEFINYPISTFDNMDETIGITFASHNENRDGTLKERMEIYSLYDYIVAVTMTLCRSSYVSQITERYLARSIVVHIHKNITSMQFGLTLDEKMYIYECGIEAANNQLDALTETHAISTASS